MSQRTKPKSQNRPALFNPELERGERKATKKQAKAQRKAARLQDETAQESKIVALNDATQRIDYIAILDFEATCDDVAKLSVQEVIEFPTVFVSTETGEIDHIFHTYVQPQVHPKLTPFCTELTGIQQQTVDNGVPLFVALSCHQAFLDEHGLVSVVDFLDTSCLERIKDKKTFVYATCGDWDLKTCLPNQLKHLKIKCPRALTSWCNLKVAFQQFYGIKARGMTSMLSHVELNLEGRHHSGIDDCKNLARIVQKMLKQGWKPKGVTGTTLR